MAAAAAMVVVMAGKEKSRAEAQTGRRWGENRVSNFYYT